MIYVYPIAPALILGILNWLYWRRQGFTSVGQLVLGIIVFYALSYPVIKYFID